MDCRFAMEPLTPQLWDEALPLLFAHWKEVAHYQDIELTPDRARYAQLEQNGVVRVFTARTAVNLLVGYALFTITPALHYRQIRIGMQDVIYVQPNARGSLGYRFVDYCTTRMFEQGADVVYQHVKLAHNFGKLLERQGYEPIEILYGKRRPVAAVTEQALAGMAVVAE